MTTRRKMYSRRILHEFHSKHWLRNVQKFKTFRVLYYNTIKMF